MKLITIAAVGKNRELGKDNDLIWHIKEDLQYFKKVTTGKNILMGKNTFNSLGRLLPNRHHIIISTSLNIDNPEVEVFRSLEDFFETYKENNDEVYIIGGASIYKAFMPYVEEMHLTEIDESFEADVFFPEYDSEEFERKIVSEFSEPYNYKHVLLQRKRK